MTTSGVVSTVATLPATTGGSYSLGFNFTNTTPDYLNFVFPGITSGAILSVLKVMQSVYGTTFPGMIDGANIEQPQAVVGIPAGGNHIVGPVLIDNNFEGGLSVDDWNIVFTNMGQPQPATNIYGLVTNMLATANWLAAGGLGSPGVSNVPYLGNDRREIKLGRASKFYSQYVSGNTLPGSPGGLVICGTGSAGGTNGQVFFNKAYKITGPYPDTAANPYVCTELPMVVSTLTSTPVKSSPITATGGDLEPYAQKLLQDWMQGVNINSQFQAVTNAWTGYVRNVSGTATFGTFGTHTRDLCHYANLARATGLWATATNGQTVLTQVFNALDDLALNSTTPIKALPQTFTIGAGPGGNPPGGVILSDAGNALPEANMQYLLARNPFASNNPNGWFHP